MKKKVIVAVSAVFIIIFIVLGIVIAVTKRSYTEEELRALKIYKIIKTMNLEEEQVGLEYGYYRRTENTDVIVDEELKKLIIKEITNLKLSNYVGRIQLAVEGYYKVNIGENVSFCFDKYQEDGVVLLYIQEDHLFTTISPKILEEIVKIVDVELTKNTEMYRTENITITKKIDNIAVNVKEKTALDYVFENCKKIYTNKANEQTNIEEPDYEMDFNNGIKLYSYNGKSEGWLIKDGVPYKAYNLNTFDEFIIKVFDNVDKKRQMFGTNKVTITNPKKTIEVTEKEAIEKIITSMIYSEFKDEEWLKKYNRDNIIEESDWIRIKINDYEYIVPGKTGNTIKCDRFIVYPNGKIKICNVLEYIEDYANELIEK